MDLYALMQKANDLRQEEEILSKKINTIAFGSEMNLQPLNMRDLKRLTQLKQTQLKGVVAEWKLVWREIRKTENKLKKNDFPVYGEVVTPLKVLKWVRKIVQIELKEMK